MDIRTDCYKFQQFLNSINVPFTIEENELTYYIIIDDKYLAAVNAGQELVVVFDKKKDEKLRLFHIE